MMKVMMIVFFTMFFISSIIPGSNPPQEKNGRYFFPIGINRFFIYVDENNRDNLSPCEYMKLLKDHGIDYVRVFVAEPAFEPKLGEYDEGYLKRMDEMFECAEKLKIKIMLALFDHYAFRFKWNESAYNLKNGGIVKHPIELYTNDASIEYEKRRIKFIVERYKNSSALFAWEPINELDGIARFFFIWKDKALNWFKMMRDYIRSLDEKHLITESLTGDNFWDDLNREVDLIQIHTYSVMEWRQIPKVARKYIDLTERYDKPVVIGEFAPKKDYKERGRFIRTFLWTFLTAKIPAWLWTHKYDPYGDATDEDLKIYKAYSDFAKFVGMDKLAYLGKAEKFFEYDSEIFVGMFDRCMIGYIPNVKGRKIRIKNLPDRFKEILWIDTEDFKVLYTEQLECENHCTVKVPELPDLAFVVR